MENKKLLSIAAVGAVSLGGLIFGATLLPKHKEISVKSLTRFVSGTLLLGGLGAFGGILAKDAKDKIQKTKLERTDYVKGIESSISEKSILDCTVRNKSLSSEDCSFVMDRLFDLRKSILNSCTKKEAEKYFLEFSNVIDVLTSNDSDYNGKLVAHYRKKQADLEAKLEREERLETERIKRDTELAKLETIKNTITESVGTIFKKPTPDLVDNKATE